MWCFYLEKGMFLKWTYFLWFCFGEPPRVHRENNRITSNTYQIISFQCLYRLLIGHFCSCWRFVSYRYKIVITFVLLSKKKWCPLILRIIWSFYGTKFSKYGNQFLLFHWISYVYVYSLFLNNLQWFLLPKMRKRSK